MKSIPALLIIILFAYNFLNVFSYEDWLSFGDTGENNINNNVIPMLFLSKCWFFKVNITKTYLPQPSGPRTLSRTTTLAIDPKENLKFEHPYAIITQSPTIFDNAAYIGVSSNEEGAVANIPDYVCFNIATGNNYEIPENGTNCITNATTPEKKSACHDPSNFLDLILTLDIEKGDYPAGPDYGKIIISDHIDIILHANAKSGITWALNVATVEIIWFVTSGPGSIDGGNVRLCYSTSKPATFGDAIVAIDILEILWQTANPTQAVVLLNGIVYADSGYERFGKGGNNTKVFALSIV
ncbi:1036_t:CDS:10 [Rhizophagus irregularis]|nr:1036_t:CDS:10 [Rhizophagus irregularis]